MATIAEGGLFPPIIDAYLPGINVKTVILDEPRKLKIKYNTSPYNNLEDIKSVHISITRQSDYTSLFRKDNYPRGVYVVNHTPISEDDEIEIDGLSCLQLQQLAYNEYYKVQVRLSKIYCPTVEPGESPPAQPLTGQELSNYLVNEDNLSNFSEWSTVCLIRFIAKPIFNIDANGQALDNVHETVFHTSNLRFSGNYKKGNLGRANSAYFSSLIKNIVNGNNDLEYLSSYNVSLLTNTQEQELVFKSEEITVSKDNPTSFQYEMPYFFEDGDNFIVRFHFTTANLYEEDVDRVIRIAYSKSSWSDQNIVSETIGLDTVIGKVNITFEPQAAATPIPQGSIFTIRRSDNTTDFTYWETIWKKTLDEDVSTLISYDDFTIESGTIYKYEINYTDTNGDSYFIVEGPILSVFNDSFLTGEGTQLSVKFNPNIGSFKRNVGDAVVNTIGGKYPYITRNGSMDYRTFSLSGTIAYEMDNEHQFTSRSDIYGDWIDVYGSYFVNHYYNQRNDRITQRKFRELVMDYLYSDMPKLFRSTPEGNILVRITNVTLTPNTQLARMIYDFSCDVTEIGEASIQNYKLYKIQDFGEV